jgi:hypothetical protein
MVIFSFALILIEELKEILNSVSIVTKESMVKLKISVKSFIRNILNNKLGNGPMKLIQLEDARKSLHSIKIHNT